MSGIGKPMAQRSISAGEDVCFIVTQGRNLVDVHAPAPPRAGCNPAACRRSCHSEACSEVKGLRGPGREPLRLSGAEPWASLSWEVSYRQVAWAPPRGEGPGDCPLWAACRTTQRGQPFSQRHR